MTTYIASEVALADVLATQSFASIAKAKAWARQRDGEVVISDEAMPSRYIKRISVNGAAKWVGSAPASWFSA